MGCSFSVMDVWFVANSPISNPEKGEQVTIVAKKAVSVVRLY
jgi:hypothetical protein